MYYIWMFHSVPVCKLLWLYEILSVLWLSEPVQESSKTEINTATWWQASRHILVQSQQWKHQNDVWNQLSVYDFILVSYC